jgi:hypothetical protein
LLVEQTVKDIVSPRPFAGEGPEVKGVMKNLTEHQFGQSKPLRWRNSLMRNTENANTTYRHRLAAMMGLGLALLVAVGVLSFGQKQGQPVFPSADKATDALVAAIQKNDEQATMRILGGGKELISSGDELEDKLDRELFIQKYHQMHRFVREADLYMRLYVGAENWPFPVPLVSKKGRWRFDSMAGAREILFRRIGENESIAMDTCRALILASQGHDGQAAADDPISQYARALVSGQANNGSTAATKDVQSSGPFYGYYYTVLSGGQKGVRVSGTTIGGIVFLAYPARYRWTGVMTFIAGPDNVVYEKDLGPNTAQIAKAITGWKADASWHIADGALTADMNQRQGTAK